jgi:hypothetical protein
MDERAYSDYHLIQKITDWDRIRQEILSEPANLSPRVKATKRRHGLRGWTRASGLLERIRDVMIA